MPWCLLHDCPSIRPEFRNCAALRSTEPFLIVCATSLNREFAYSQDGESRIQVLLPNQVGLVLFVFTKAFE